MILPSLQIALNSSGNHLENFSFLLLVEKEILISVLLQQYKIQRKLKTNRDTHLHQSLYWNFITIIITASRYYVFLLIVDLHVKN